MSLRNAFPTTFEMCGYVQISSLSLRLEVNFPRLLTIKPRADLHLNDRKNITLFLISLRTKRQSMQWLAADFKVKFPSPFTHQVVLEQVSLQEPSCTFLYKANAINFMLLISIFPQSLLQGFHLLTHINFSALRMLL